jgi:hypothetical protein
MKLGEFLALVFFEVSLHDCTMNSRSYCPKLSELCDLELLRGFALDVCTSTSDGVSDPDVVRATVCPLVQPWFACDPEVVDVTVAAALILV